jgi:hypothetical protein
MASPESPLFSQGENLITPQDEVLNACLAVRLKLFDPFCVPRLFRGDWMRPTDH